MNVPENEIFHGFDSIVIVGNIFFDGRNALVFVTHHFDDNYNFINIDTAFFSLEKNNDTSRLYQWVKYFNGEYKWMEIANDDDRNGYWKTDSISILSDSSYIEKKDTITVKQQNKCVLSYHREYTGYNKTTDTTYLDMQYQKCNKVSKKQIFRDKYGIIDEKYDEKEMLEEYYYTEKIGLRIYYEHTIFLPDKESSKILIRYNIR